MIWQIIKDVCAFDPLSLNIVESYKNYQPDSLPVHKEFSIVPSIEKVRIYTRLNVIVDTPKRAHQLMNTNGGCNNEKIGKILHTYDIVSATTDNEKILELLIHKSDVDIISLDFCEYLKFFFNKKLLRQAVEKQVMFEICYGKAIGNQSAYRKYFMSKVSELVENIKGKNLIISSGTNEELLHRNPHDAMSLGKLIGISQNDARAALSSNWENCIKRGKLRKCFKGVADIADEKDLAGTKPMLEVE